MQIDAGATDAEMKFDVTEVFRVGQHTAERTRAKNGAAPVSNFAANHAGEASDHIIVLDQKAEIGPAEVSAYPGVLDCAKALSTELMAHAKDYAMKTLEKATGRAADAMKTVFLVDSGASRDGLPVQHFLTYPAALRETAVTSSNGVARGLMYTHGHMPRLLLPTRPTRLSTLLT